MVVSGSTRVVGIFGDPVSHSLSPLMQNAAIQGAGIDAVYVPFHVGAAQLCDAVRAIRALGLAGVNLTIPHKEAACRLVDELDPVAELSGAVNTIVNREGRLLGYNTDGAGLLRAVREDLGVDSRGKRVLIVGAGGAARAAMVAMAGAGAAWIGVANRTPGRAEQLVAELAAKLTGTAFAAFPLEGLAGRLDGGVDLLINSSAAGLQGQPLDLPVGGCVRPDGAVYDMVYGREPTALVVAARAAGLAAADGLGMLAGQGEEAFRLWFSSAPPPGAMRAALEHRRNHG
ncbi:MAG: shikimate dehydrogenase [Deltaproteobacteria bacterium]|nr:MAG: shikimate dehydrogenase [Deltaproteobacteria bacterium]